MTDPSQLPDPEEFADPLENYDPKTYNDPMEEALAEETVEAIQHRPVATTTPNTPAHEAIAALAEQQVACLLVEDEGRLVGVFSDRDVLNRVALEYDEVKDKPIKDLMTVDPVYIYETDSAVSALSVMAVCGVRHVPVVDTKEELVGIVSPQRVTSFLRTHAGG